MPANHVIFAPDGRVVMQIEDADGDYRAGQQGDTVDGQWRRQFARHLRHSRDASQTFFYTHRQVLKLAEVVPE